MKTRMPASVKVGASPSLALAPLGSLQRACTCGARAGLDGQCTACRHDRLIGHRHPSDRTTSSEAPPLVAEVLRSPAQPLDSASRTLMEARFSHHAPHLPSHAPTPAAVMHPVAIGPADSRSEQEAAHTAERASRGTGLPGRDAAVSPISYDFSQVRIHTDTRAAASAESIDALAYSYGRDIAFARGQYRPETMAGRELLAHELAHVLQAPQHPAIVQREKKRRSRAVSKKSRSRRAAGRASSPIVWEPPTDESFPGYTGTKDPNTGEDILAPDSSEEYLESMYTALPNSRAKESLIIEEKREQTYAVKRITDLIVSGAGLKVSFGDLQGLTPEELEVLLQTTRDVLRLAKSDSTKLKARTFLVSILVPAIHSKEAKQEEQEQEARTRLEGALVQAARDSDEVSRERALQQDAPSLPTDVVNLVKNRAQFIASNEGNFSADEFKRVLEAVDLVERKIDRSIANNFYQTYSKGNTLRRGHWKLREEDYAYTEGDKTSLNPPFLATASTESLASVYIVHEPLHMGQRIMAGSGASGDQSGEGRHHGAELVAAQLLGDVKRQNQIELEAEFYTRHNAEAAANLCVAYAATSVLESETRSRPRVEGLPQALARGPLDARRMFLEIMTKNPVDYTENLSTFIEAVRGNFFTGSSDVPAPWVGRTKIPRACWPKAAAEKSSIPESVRHGSLK